MGNCHATTAAAIEVEHPSGKKERFYWPMLARQLMLQNPGHYVALFSQQLPGCTVYANHSFFSRSAEIFTPQDAAKDKRAAEVGKSGKPKLKLMPPDAPLVVGSSYRLVTFEEALQFSRGRMSGMARDAKHKVHPDVSEVCEAAEEDTTAPAEQEAGADVEEDEDDEALMATVAMHAAYPRSLGRQQWRPALQSIAEAGW